VTPCSSVDRSRSY